MIKSEYPQKKVKFLNKVVNGSTPKSSIEEFWDGEILWVTPEDLSKSDDPMIWGTKRRITPEGYSSCGTILCPEGSIVVSTRAPIGSIGIASTPLCTNQGCKTLVPKNEVFSKYEFFQLSVESDSLNSLGKGTTFKELSSEDFKNFKLLNPPLETQKQIADFLDKETTRIDTLITKKQKQIELLQEKRQAIITQAVTKGLNPDVKMKDSGVEWIGEIPEHWGCIKHSILLKKLEQGWSPVAENKGVAPGEWGVVKISCISRGKFVQEENKSLIPGTEIRKKYQIQKSDVLMSRGNTVDLVGDVCFVEKIEHNLMFSDLVYRLGYQEDRIVKKFVMYFLLSRVGRFQISRDASGSSMTMAKISQENIKNWIITVPPIKEQREITQNIDFQLTRNSNLVTKVISSIDLLKEYRSSLITHAVSGQIDITQYEVSK